MPIKGIKFQRNKSTAGGIPNYSAKVPILYKEITKMSGPFAG